MKSLGKFSLKFSGILLGFLVLGLISGCQKEEGALTETDSATSASAVSVNTRNYMVLSKTESFQAGFDKKLAAYGEIIRSIPEIGVVVMLPTVSNFEAKVAKVEGVLAVVPDLKARFIEPIKYVEEVNPPSIGDDEPYFGYLWGMDAINAPEAWNEGYKGKGARVFILDSGIDADNPDLEVNINKALSTSFVPDEGYDIRPGHYFNHGTHVAGTIAAADNGIGVIGVAPEAEIVAVKVLSEYNGSGDFSWIDAGIVYAAQNGADVINMSLGAVVNRNGFYLDENGLLQRDAPATIQFLIVALQRAITYANKMGTVIIASAGNDYTNYDGGGAFIKLPADLTNVIAVSATAPDYWYGQLKEGITDINFDVPSSYISFGKSLVDVAAPGGDSDFYPKPFYYYDMVLSNSSESYYFASGTSMAAPHATGVAALIIGKSGGSMSPGEVEKKLIGTADNIAGTGTTDYYGKGRVNAYRALTE